MIVRLEVQRMKWMIKEQDETRRLTCGEVMPSVPMTPEQHMRDCGRVRSKR